MMFIVDSQVHIWAKETPDNPWPTLPGEDMHGAESFSADALLEEMDAAGVARAILVPPAHAGNRNDVSLAASTAYPDRFAVMGRLVLNNRQNRRLVDSWMDIPGMRGMRLNLRTPQGREWLRTGELDWFWPAAERNGIPLMIHATGVLPEIHTIALRYPALRLCIDHFALHRETGQEFVLPAKAGDALCALARCPNISVKASALPYFSVHQYPYPDLHGIIKQVIHAFGPCRVFWGTDITRRAYSYSDAIRLFTEALPWLTVDDQEQIMGRAICDWLGWIPKTEKNLEKARPELPYRPTVGQ
jgi:predicted TIM-barrel fold metal-dependent hydrolase